MRNSQPNPAIFKIIILITCFMLVMLYNKSKAADRHPCTNKIAVVFRQDFSKKELTVIVKANLSNPVQLYFFTIDGRLAKQISVNSKQETVIKDLKKGTYLYECFNDEVNLKSGKLVLQ